MNRESFKLRMKALKSYRESHPDKGYWDWHIQSYADGGDNAPLWMQGKFAGPLYADVRESIRSNDPTLYEVIDSRPSAPEMSPIVAYQDAVRVGESTQAPEVRTNNAVEDAGISFGPIGFAPIIGDIEEAMNIAYDIQNGDYRSAMIAAALLGIPGGAAGKAYRWLKRKTGYLSPRERRDIANRLREGMREYSEINDNINNIISREDIQEYQRRIDDFESSRLDPLNYLNSKYNVVNLQANHSYYHQDIPYLRERLRNLLDRIASRVVIIRNEPYDPNNLPLEFLNADYLPGDRTGALYFHMSPREAVKTAESDFLSLDHGLAWGLIRDGATSTDSYPLQLSMMSKRKDAGLIKVVRLPDGTPDMMSLNDFGNIKGDDAIHRINKKLLNISEITGVKDLKAVRDNGFIYVPKIIFRKYDEGGEVDNSLSQVNPYTGQPIASGRINNAFSLRTLLDFTPIGDALSIRDVVNALGHNDWLGAGITAASLFPFIPSVNRRAIQEATDRAIRQVEKKDAVLDEFYNQRNGVIESLIENEDAFRRAANADISSNANYLGTYQNMLNSYLADPSRLNSTLPRAQFDPNLYATEIKAQVNPNDLSTITLNPRYYDVDEVDNTFQLLNPGLVRHELGHQVDVQSGLDYTDRLSNPDKFVSDDRLKELYPKSYKSLRRNVLNRGSEIKSYMNEFRDYVNTKEGVLDFRIGPKSFQRKLDKYKEEFPTLYKIFNSYKSKKDFMRDFNSVPLVETEDRRDLV